MSFVNQLNSKSSAASAKRPQAPPQIAQGKKKSTVPGGGPTCPDPMPSNSKRAKGSVKVNQAQVASFPAGKISGNKNPSY